jgi:predicted transcriptional regulator
MQRRTKREHRTRIHMRMDPQLQKRLVACARRDGKTTTRIVEEAVRDYLARA